MIIIILFVVSSFSIRVFNCRHAKGPEISPNRTHASVEKGIEICTGEKVATALRKSRNKVIASN